MVRTHACQRFFIYLLAPGNQHLNRSRHGHDIVENEQIRGQMMVFDHFALFVPRVFRQEPTSTEGNPLNKEVERLALIRCPLNRTPEFDIGYVVEQEPSVPT